MTGEELRRLIEQLGWPLKEASHKLGLTLSGLQHQLRGVRPVSKQTELLIAVLCEMHLTHRDLRRKEN